MDNISQKELLIYRAFIEEDDYQLICKRIAEIIGNPIYVFDSSYVLLVSSDERIDEPYIERLNENKKSLLFDGEDSLLLSGEITKIGNSDEVFISKFNDLKYPTMTKRIHDGNSLLGYASLYGKNKEFDDDDKKLLETICKIASKDLSIRKYTDRTSSYILQKIIDGRLTDKKEIDRILKDLGFTDSFFRLLAIRSDNSQFIYEILIAKHPDVVVTCYKKDVVVLVENNKLNYKHIKKEIENINKNVAAKVSISDVYNLSSSLKDAYKQADKLLTIGNSIRKDALIYCYEDYKMDLLLSIIDKNILEKAVDDRVKEIVLFDKNGDTSYIDDLRTFFKANRSINRAAEILFIHKNSMYYRLSKIQEKFEIDLENEKDCYLVETSLRILDFLNSVKEE